MAVETSAKPNLVNEYDDDDGPVIFKRSGTASKQNQLNLEVKKSSQQRTDGQSGRQSSDVHSRNGLNVDAQKGKVVSSAKASLIKSPAASPKTLTSSAKASPVKSPVNTKSNCDSEDSEDDKPLSARLKGNSNHDSKGHGKPTLSLSLPPMSKKIVQRPSEDSDDEPLSSRFQVKSNAGTSGSKPYDAAEKKPLASKVQHSGSTMMDKQQKPSATLNKRPLDKSNSSDQSLMKKPKLLDSPATTKSKQVAVKSEVKEEDDDHIPISQRMKLSVSNNKLPAAKKTVTKPISSSFKKTTNKNKKVAKNSKYSKSTKLLPSSGDGQKKWTTLVHNGVIFPPPYNPHRVKMLYNGKPVDLTPEQEEVGLSHNHFPLAFVFNLLFYFFF